MAISLFGFEIKRKPDIEVKTIETFTPKVEDDGAMVVAGGGVYGTYIDLDGTIRSEAELITRYREMSLQPEIDSAIDDIVNESFSVDEVEKPVAIVLDDTKLSTNIQKMIMDEFNSILQKLEFNQHAYDIYRRWYIDGRLYYHVVIDEAKPNEGINQLRYIDPRHIRKIREIKRKKTKNNPQITVPETSAEYYVYSEKGFSARKSVAGTAVPSSTNAGALKIAKDSIVYVTSGLTSPNNDMVLSYLHKAIKPLNMLRSMEDSLLIYRIARAPDRRAFYIDVGNLPKIKAEQYMRDIMTRFKNKLVYNPATGEIKDDRKFMSMLEDFWLPRREGGRGTEIVSLGGGETLGQIDDIVYFQEYLYKSLNVPVSRIKNEGMFNVGRSAEITRDEIKFNKFITRLRTRFSTLFIKLLEKQLILKNIMTVEDWDEISNLIRFDFAKDNYFEELKEAEMLRDRMATLRDANDYVGRYYSHDWVRKNILKQTEEQISDEDEKIKEEQDNPQFNPPIMDPGSGDKDPTMPGVQDRPPAKL